MHIALTRKPSPELVKCELTHISREPINMGKAYIQHREYERSLEEMGCEIFRLPDLPDHADGIFVEDTAVVFPEVAVIARPGAVSRRKETESVASSLQQWRELRYITKPATLDGGDVFMLGKRVLCGISTRTNKEGVRQLRSILDPFGYTVEGIPVEHCLHLKTAFAHVADDVMLVNPDWIDPSLFPSMKIIHVDSSEPYAANALKIGGEVLYPEVFNQTRQKLEAENIPLRTIDVSELSKAEAGLTCSSIVFTP